MTKIKSQITLHLTKSGQELKEKVWKQELKEKDHGRILLTGLFSRLMQSYLSYPSQDYLLREGTTHSGLDCPTSIIKQKNALIDLLAGQSDGGIFSIVILSPKMILACNKFVVEPTILKTAVSS